MSDICRFAGHVGSGDDEHLVLRVGRVDVVGDETSRSEDIFDHRVTTVFNLECVAIVEERHCPIVFGGDACEGEADIDVGHRIGSSHYRRGVFDHLLTDTAVDGLLKFRDKIDGA